MEMDAETERDNVWLASFIEFCKPTATQVAQLHSCIFAPESNNFDDSNRDQPSPSPSPSQAPVIFMVSPPGSLNSADNEEGAVFLTPPEHNSHSQLSSSEDQNPNELRAEANRPAKRARTEVVESEGVEDTEVISEDSNGEERAASLPAQGGGGDEVGEKVKEIEEFRYVGGVNGRCEAEPRRLPPSLKGKEEGKEKDVVESSEKKSVLFGLLDVLETIFGDADSGSDDVDFLETAKRRGMKFPRPRWWPDEGF